MLLIPKKKEEQKGSAFTETQAKSVTSNVDDINSNLYGFFGTLNKKDKQKFIKSKVEHMQLMEQLSKGDDSTNSPKKKEADKKWFKIVGVMSKGIGGLFKGVANIAKGLASKATGIIGFLLGIFIILKLGLLQTLVPAALDMLKTLVTGIIEVLPSIIKWAWDILVEWVPKLVNAFADAISNALGLSKESKLRKVMPYLVGIGAGLLALFKVASMFGMGGGILKLLGSGLMKLIPLLMGPVGIIAAIAAVGFGIFEFVKNSEAVSDWAKNKKKELDDQNKADLALIQKYKGTDLSKLNAETYAQLKEATERQAGFWKDIKGVTFTGVQGAADAATDYKTWVDQEDKFAFQLRMKQNKTAEETARMQLAAVDSWQVGSSDFWKAFVNPKAMKISFQSLFGMQDDYTKSIEKRAQDDKKKVQDAQKAVTKGMINHDQTVAKIKKEEEKRKFASAESQKKYFNVWGMQDKQKQKKQIAALKESQKVTDSYWEKLKSGAQDVWNKMPSAKEVKGSLSISNAVSKMEEFFQPFLDKAKGVFRSIGDFFSSIVDGLIISIRHSTVLGHLVSGQFKNKESDKEYILRKHTESLMADSSSGRAGQVDAYAKALRGNKTAKAAEIGAKLSDADKETALQLNKIGNGLDKSVFMLNRLLGGQENGNTGIKTAEFRPYGAYGTSGNK